MTKQNMGHAFITGGTSGLGFAMAQQLAIEGYSVTIMGRNEDRLAKSLENLRKIHPDIMGITGDITQQQDLEKAVE